MVSILKIEEKFPYLFSSASVASLERLLLDYAGPLPAFHSGIIQKDKSDLSFHEKKYLSWLRHSLAFKLKQTSPRKILESWTLDVTELLSGAWGEIFLKEDEVALAFLGKLGSGELNLSSDIDVIFFGESSLKLRKIREFIKAVGDLNLVPAGFKVDLDLRPGGASAPMVCSPTRLGDHLWNSSDPWERYSYTRMDIQLGAGKVIETVTEVRDKFCYRKYLSSDFFHSFVKMRKDYRVECPKDSLNVKLGAGGIRDIELFVQTFQILHGGKDVKFRGLSTFDLLDLFIRENINKEIFEKLRLNYVFLRQAEGEIHALNEVGGFDWVKSESEFDEILFESAKSSNDIINDYITSSENIFGSSSSVLRPSTFKDKIEALIPEGSDKKEKALTNLDQYFLSKKHQFKSYYSAILSQEKVAQAFVDLLQYSDYGCQILSRRPSLLDVFFLRRSAVVHEDEEVFLNSLSDSKMIQRILASSEFRKNKDMVKLGENVTSSYEMILKEIIKPEDGIDLLFFGKMAAGEMGLSSDLDFIMVTDSEKVLTKKARLLYRKLSYLTVFGPLVPYDTDGGPMGKATPLLLTWATVKEFLKEKAEPWQKLMYLKQRRLFSDEEVKYLDGEMSEDDVSSLFDVLRERLRASTYKKDPYKQGLGGLFHIEFIIGALFLRLGVQPPGNLKMRDLMDLLGKSLKESSVQELKENYYKVAASREEMLIEDIQRKDVESVEMERSFEILEELSEKYLYGLKVGM